MLILLALLGYITGVAIALVNGFLCEKILEFAENDKFTGETEK